ncbi:hypothetical protein Golax_019052, partial [Gossypium laxum]|nr:hypothetical protein [Gossypium davidsonii]MBA0706970.1 hypothetical protein [Gossypium laxum]
MSRCFPYPPPGYVKNGIRDEALIESIKIKREEEKAKKERKKEKKEKKEKKREKKERDKSRDSGEAESKKHGHKKRHKDERSKEDQKGGDRQKKRENEVECFEKSTLTEEHGQAVGPQNSSDSTLNSSKRQKLSSPPDSGQNPGECVCISSFPGGGCLLVGFVCFTWALMLCIQIVIINVKEALSGSDCLPKGIKIL